MAINAARRDGPSATENPADKALACTRKNSVAISKLAPIVPAGGASRSEINNTVQLGGAMEKVVIVKGVVEKLGRWGSQYQGGDRRKIYRFHVASLLINGRWIRFEAVEPGEVT